MSIDWNKNQPIIKHLREILPQVFPILRTSGHGLHSSGVGGYNNRLTHFGGESLHSSGRAADIFLNADISIEEKIGDGLFYMFINNANQLGVDHVIWNRQIWSIHETGIRIYAHGDHRDHVHVAFTVEGSQSRPLMLETYANRVRMAIVQGIRSKIATGN